MDAGRRRSRAGLLNCVKRRKLLVLLGLLPLFAEGLSGEELRVLVQTAPALPQAGSIWTLTLLIDHPFPDEVSVLAPPFTGAFFLDQTLKGSRILNARGEEALQDSSMLRHWTAAEYRFVLNSPGGHRLDPFTVICPRGTVTTPPLDLVAQNPPSGAGLARPPLFWEKPAALAAGEAAILELRTTARLAALPPEEAFLPQAPRGFLLEQEPLPESLRETGILLRLRLVPLDGSVFSIPGRSISGANAIFEIPALRMGTSAPSAALPAKNIPLSAMRGRDGSPPSPLGAIDLSPPRGAPLDSAPSNGGAISFPDFNPGQFPGSAFFAASWKEACARAKDLWDRGSRAGALAELRRYERDSSAGPLAAPLRREAEQRLGITAPDERWRPGALISACACLGPGLLLFFAGRKKIRRLCSLFAFAAALVFLYLFLESSMPWKPRSAVLQETVLRRVPDAAGAGIARLAGGTPARLGREYFAGEPGAAAPDGENWVWAEVLGEDSTIRAGWIPAGKAVFY
jgi:hypothetical protein